MAFKFEFVNYWGHKVDETLQFSLLKGDTDNVIHRDNVTENVNPDNLVYDSENSKIYKRPNHIIIIKGKLEITFNWSVGDILEADLNRYKTLNATDTLRQAGVITETSTSDAITNNKLVTTYEYGKHYASLQDRSQLWNLATEGEIKALEDDTRIFCILSENGSEYNTNITSYLIDIGAGETKTITQQGSENFVFFGESLSVSGTAIDTNTLKKMTSSSIAVTNDGSVTQRLILITR
tara:strand:- start:873 stop:1583 length:711 start_codon:yes stop_codon:yes gene_type:complete